MSEEDKANLQLLYERFNFTSTGKTTEIWIIREVYNGAELLYW